MATNKRALASAAMLAVGLAVGGAAVANAAANGTIAATLPGATSTTTPGTTSTGGTSTGGSDATAPGHGRGMHAHTTVTGDELAKVTAAVTAKQSGVTVSQVQKDPDGSYDVFGTKDGATVRFEVSADLATVTQGGMGPGGRVPGGMGGHTAVTGDEATKVGDAVKAKDSAVVVERVMKDPDGSYDVLGTKDGARVKYDVSADLATVTQAAAGGMHGEMRGGMGHAGPRQDGQTHDGQSGQTQTPSAPSTAS